MPARCHAQGLFTPFGHFFLSRTLFRVATSPLHSLLRPILETHEKLTGIAESI